MTGRARRAAGAVAVVMAAVVVGAGCGSDQDPGIPAEGGPSGPATTSVTLGPCPPGGPDATTPPAGCLDEDGSVIRHP